SGPAWTPGKQARAPTCENLGVITSSRLGSAAGQRYEGRHPGTPALGPKSAAVGDGGVVCARGGPTAEPGDKHLPTGGAGGNGGGGLPAVGGPVVTLDPQLGAGGGAVADRGVVGA